MEKYIGIPDTLLGGYIVEPAIFIKSRSDQGNTRVNRRKHRTTAQRGHKAISEPYTHMERIPLCGIWQTADVYDFGLSHTEHPGVRLRREMSPEPMITESVEISRLLEPLFVLNRPARSVDDKAEDDFPPARTGTQVALTLAEHDCPDVTPMLVLEKCSQKPFTVGGESMIYHGVMKTPTSNKLVAIKCRFQPQGKDGAPACRDIAKELYVWSRCCHPNVLPLLGLARYQGRIAVVMPLVQAGCLADYILSHSNLNRLSICSQIGDGLAHLHSRGIAHGDIKARNLLVLNDETIQLADFGSSVIKNHSLHFSSGTEALHMTPNWAAPEVLSNKVSRTTMSDVYSYGMTMLEIITGEAPFIGLATLSIYVRVVCHKKRPERPLCCVPCDHHGDKFWRLLQQCWSAEPLHRPSAFQVKNNLRSIRFDFTKLSPGTHGGRRSCAPICGYKPRQAI
ncbi:kinase-like domain-containing protein [Rhizoctonia solani]|nr:kinase-like domain-containing protein [Rhizoctonia solani]